MDTEAVEMQVESPPPALAPPAPAASADLGYVEPELISEDWKGVPLVPLVSSIGWVTDLAATAAWAIGGPAGVAALVIGGLGAACAAAGVGNRYRRRPSTRGASRPAGRGASTRSGLGTTGLAGGRRSGGSGGGSRGGGGGLRGLASRGGIGKRSGGSAGKSATGSRTTGAGRAGRLLGGSGTGTGGRRGTGSSSSGGGKRGGLSMPRFGRGSAGSGSGSGGTGRRGLLGLRRASGAGGRGAGSGVGGGRGPAARIRRMLGQGPKAGLGASTGATGALRRRNPIARLLRRNRPGVNGGTQPTAAKKQRFPWLRSSAWRRKAASAAPGQRPHVGTKVATPPTPGTTGPKPTASAPPPAGRQPLAPPGTARPIAGTGGMSMTGKLQVVDLSNDMASNMAGVTVEKGEMYGFLKELEKALPELNDNLARMWRGLGTAMATGMPVHPAITALLDSIGEAQNAIGDTVAELPRLARVFHEADIARIETPRTNESAWDRA